MALFFMTVCSNFDFDVIYIDFAKAFDTLLFLILNYLQFYRLFLFYGVSDHLIFWIKELLFNWSEVSKCMYEQGAICFSKCY